MKEPLKAVIDTNVFISALLGSKNGRLIRDLLSKEAFRIVVSEEMFIELKDVAARPKVKKFVETDDVLALEKLIRDTATVVTIKEHIFVCRDPEDNHVLECAVAGGADVIVTGDKDLLSMKTFEGIEIIPPREFVNRLSREAETGNNV